MKPVSAEQEDKAMPPQWIWIGDWPYSLATWMAVQPRPDGVKYVRADSYDILKQRVEELTAEKEEWRVHSREVARELGAEVAALTKVLQTCRSAISSLPTDALGQDSEEGHYYRDELLAAIEHALKGGDSQ